MPRFLKRFLNHKATAGALLTLVVVVLEALLGDER